MRQKAVTLVNRGMSRDMSVSKIDGSSVYENRNIRITVRDNDTMLSVTNERGNKEYSLNESIHGELLGWNVLNNHVILFTHEGDSTDRIYRIDYENGGFTNHLLYPTNNEQGSLGFDMDHPIESIVYHETEAIQKIYWVDGIHPLRFMNFMATSDEMSGWQNDSFDSNISSDYSVEVDITKDYSGNNRPNGVIQYLMTYYNKHGQETGYVWMSDLVYLSPKDNGGSADGTNTCKVTFRIKFDENNRFTNFRIYSVFRSSLNIAQASYIVADGEIVDDYITVVDDGYHVEAQDISRLLYLGSQNVNPTTITHKDQTMFLGGLETTGQNYGWLKDLISLYHIYDEETGLIDEIYPGTHWVEFMLDGGIPYPDNTGDYYYESQLLYSSSEILTFKGGEKYRFAISLKTKDGAMTPAFWIGDMVNNLYPVIDENNHVIQRVVARFVIPKDMYDEIVNRGFTAVQLMMAEATYADRSVKAQGIVNPTMFNVWERYNDRLYSMSSWFSRPRGEGVASGHFSPVNNSISSTGEIQCNYWDTEKVPTPFYEVVGGHIVDELDGVSDYDFLKIIYSYKHAKSHRGSNNDEFYITMFIIKASGTEPSDSFTSADQTTMLGAWDWTNLSVAGAVGIRTSEAKGNYKQAYAWIDNTLNNLGITDINMRPLDSEINNWYNAVSDKSYHYQAQGSSLQNVTLLLDALNDAVWNSSNGDPIASANNYTLSLYKRHLMFVDENVVTLDSPELSYEAVSIDIPDNDAYYKFRIVGVAKITGGYSDYTVEATHAHLSGENLIKTPFSSSGEKRDRGCLVTWPLWKENGLVKDNTGNPPPPDKDVEDRTPDYYVYTSNINKYWLYPWNHSGKIDAFTKKDIGDFSTLKSKTFATLRFSGYTRYNSNQYFEDYIPQSIRMFNSTGSQYTGINVSDDKKYYDGSPNMSLSLAGKHKYPVLFSTGSVESDDILTANPQTDAHLFINDPVQITFMSNPHAVLSLPSYIDQTDNKYTQEILPYIFDNDSVVIGGYAKIPWNDEWYKVEQRQMHNPFSIYDTESLSENDRYLMIGEIYYDYNETGAVDNRYGGVSDFAVENNRFIPAGPMLRLSELDEFKVTPSPGTTILFGYKVPGDSGDTYFQRWDCMRTRPYGDGDENNVIDVVSVMLETHVNIDGRTDNYRGTKYLASVDPEKFGNINPVYSQQDNFFSSRHLDEDFDQDTYRSSITWTLDKTDSADIDEWTHITLANSLKLDGDKGACQALRRFNNTIIAFQDRAISEILFNSRTQLSTTSGVPVEIANSGKVDGKRYITNKYGCVNKWSIIEGKAALYFVDNINKAFCAFGGQGIQPLSTKLGFDAWFRRINSVKPWAPDATFNNIVAYYDRIHSDVYLIGTGEAYGDIPCLVYNETLGVFTSFYDYSKVPMMANVEDRFVSVRDHKLWLQNEGMYCNFFGTDYGYSVEYRATPDPYGDKIWTNVDYRADYYRLLDNNADSVVPERLMINGEYYDDIAGTYQDDKTFDSLRIWNEYQNTGEVALGMDYTTDKTTRRKFRIWHVAIPRSVKTERNKWGLDRIRNPWISLLFKKNANSDNRKDMAQIHDVTVRYFE